jgi:hypothetical protein
MTTMALAVDRGAQRTPQYQEGTASDADRAAVAEPEKGGRGKKGWTRQ